MLGKRGSQQPYLAIDFALEKLGNFVVGVRRIFSVHVDSFGDTIGNHRVDIAGDIRLCQVDRLGAQDVSTQGCIVLQAIATSVLFFGMPC